jgi:phosphatidylglycerophosphatase A
MKPSASGILATFFGLGLVPLAPGTVGSLVAALFYKAALHALAWPVYLLLAVVLFFIGAGAAARHAAELGRPDPGRIVVDEVCGQLVACAFLPASWISVAVAFALFRFFDIIKPWPIRKLEGLPGGWGIMADDVGAGLAAAAFARLVLLAV